ncbi:hypothetical protein [Candidatus Parabeggiatoa sp. HSG14]|uniref:hypothetical protein n=1 Tax=Candidatus Parabeggiatoa sp. HSG14 TaxID=3055593 RepID=UPI0025A6E173|nr:hypothetical protein [Thiotrichales bacterium HSG14]
MHHVFFLAYIKNLKKNYFLQIVSVVFSTVLLWTGVSSLSYAETGTTYYAFVTHKFAGENIWRSVYGPDKLLPGLYRFQIVIFPQSSDNTAATWYALRRELKFVKDPQGGVKVTTRMPLDKQYAANSWSNNWENARRKQLQPMLGYMDKKQPLGHPDPNLMRFLLLKKDVETSWQLRGKNYRLYRLHYLSAGIYRNEEHIKAFSRFVNPAEVPSTDVKQLKEWVDSQDAFRLAKYMATPDEKHSVFYQTFKAWSHQWLGRVKKFSSLEETSVSNENESSSVWSSLFFGVLIVVLVTIISIAIGLPEKLRYLQNLRHLKKLRNLLPFRDSSEEVSPFISNKRISKPYLAKPNQMRATRTSNPSTESITESIEEFEILQNEIKQLRATIHQLKEEQIKEMNQKLVELESLQKTTLTLRENNIGKTQGLSHEEMSKLVWKVLTEHFSVLLSNITSALFKNQEFKKAMENQIDAYLRGQFNDNVNKTLEQFAKQYWNEFIEEQKRQEGVALNQHQENILIHQVQPTIPQFKEEENIHEERKEKPQTTEEKTNKVEEEIQEERKEKPQTTEEKTNKVDDETSLIEGKTSPISPPSLPLNVVEKIKTGLLNVETVDKPTLNDLDTTVEPCIFVVNVVANCLEVTLPVAHYQNLNKTIQELTGDSVSLIIANVGDKIIQEEHNIVTKTTETSEKPTTVTTLVRPGVKCGNIVQRKAEVV